MIWLAALLMLTLAAGCTNVTVLGTHNNVNIQKGKEQENEAKLRPKVDITTGKKHSIGNPHK